MLRKLHLQIAYAELNPFDAKRLGIESGARIRVSSRRGSVLATAVITATISRGQVFIPMHYDMVNQLTLPAFDPESAQPGYKACAVNVTSEDAGPVPARGGLEDNNVLNHAHAKAPASSLRVP